MTRLIRFGGWAALVGGTLRIAALFVPYVAGSAALELFYAVIDSGLLLGLLAAYLGTAERTGGFGFAAFLVALLGIASILGPTSLEYYFTGASIFAVALALFAVTLLRAQMLRLAASLWLVSAVVGAVSTATATPTLFGLAGVLLGAGYVALCPGLIALRSAPASH